MKIRPSAPPLGTGNPRRGNRTILRFLAACEPILARIYWPCLAMRTALEEQRENEKADSWYLDSALRAGRKAGNHHA